MSDLTLLEKHKLEKLLEMSGGYVLGFSNREFQEFVTDSTGKNIYDARYARGSGSKANRLRSFWDKEPNHLVGKLIKDLVGFCKGRSDTDSLKSEGRRIADRLLLGAAIEELDAITPNATGEDFELLAEAIRSDIARNRPEAGLDRLHTFVVKYIRTLCQRHGISVDRDKPIHSLVGEYAKLLKAKGLIESQMSELILKSSISTLEAFNKVRSDQSFAHDNPILRHHEGLLIFNHVAASIRFLRSIEERIDLPESVTESNGEPNADLPL